MDMGGFLPKVAYLCAIARIRFDFSHSCSVEALVRCFAFCPALGHLILFKSNFLLPVSLCIDSPKAFDRPPFTLGRRPHHYFLVPLSLIVAVFG